MGKTGERRTEQKRVIKDEDQTDLFEKCQVRRPE